MHSIRLRNVFNHKDITHDQTAADPTQECTAQGNDDRKTVKHLQDNLAAEHNKRHTDNQTEIINNV